MRIVKDERLMIEGLKHIRLVFILQNIIILGIVFYRYVLQGAGYESVSDLLMVFMCGIIVINFLNLKIQWKCMSIRAEYHAVIL